MGTAGMATAFKAVLGAQAAARPRVAILAEYDALPGLGHGCGHNLIGTSAIGAGPALKEVVPDLPGSIWVLGTPAEESARRTRAAKFTWSTPVFSTTLTPPSCSILAPKRR